MLADTHVRKLRDVTIILQALRLMFKVYLPGLSTSTSNTEQVAPTYLQSSRAIGSRQYYQHPLPPPPSVDLFMRGQRDNVPFHTVFRKTKRKKIFDPREQEEYAARQLCHRSLRERE